MKMFLAGIAEHHANLTRPDWLYSGKDWKYRVGALVLILLAGLVNFEVRDRQWEQWKSQPEQHFLNGMPMVSTNDAGFFLSHAREYQHEETLGTFERSRLYPDHTEAYWAANDPDFVPAESRPAGATDVPLLSVMVAHMAELFTRGELVLAGNLMIPFSAFLTALAIGGMFWVAGYPSEGAIAAVGTGMSTGYLVRTSIGRIDTDQLFLFFTAVCFALALLAAKQKTTPRMLGFALLTALAASLAHWWHSAGLFLVVVPVALAVGVYLHQPGIKRTGMALAAFVIAANPVAFFSTAKVFIPRVADILAGIVLPADSGQQAGGLTFPDTFTTVGEQGSSGILDTLDLLTPHPVLAIAGVLGYLAWTVLYPRKGAVFLPLFILGMLSFAVGIRYVFFAAPFVWFGLAWMFLCLTRWLAAFSQRKSRAGPFFAGGATLAAAALALIGVASLSHEDYTPSPIISVSVTKAFRDIGAIAGGKGGIIATWWDYGYHAHYHSGLDTFHDPGAQTSPRTHLLARGLTSPVQGELVQIAKFAASSGTVGILENSGSLQALNTAIAASDMPDKPLYFVLTHRLGDWMPSIASLGRFDVEKGEPASSELVDKYATDPLKCHPVSNTRLQCDDGQVDIQAGSVNGNPAYGAVAVIRDGFLLRTEKKNNNSPLVLVIQQLSDRNGTFFAVMDETNWNSSYNQLFHQGRYDPGRLDLVLDNYPIARVYRVIR